MDDIAELRPDETFADLYRLRESLLDVVWAISGEHPNIEFVANDEVSTVGEEMEMMAKLVVLCLI